MKNILNIDNGIPTLLSNVDDGTNTLYINDELVPSSEWTGTGYYTFTSGGLTFTIQKIRDDSGNIMLQLIERSGGTSYRLIKYISNAEKYYSIEDPAETDLADGDYVPFYDTSAGAKKKSLWSNIKDKLKNFFLPLFKTTTLDVDNITEDGLFWVNGAITGAPLTSYGLLLNVKNMGTPFQMYFADNNLYVYKRYYTGGAWTAWEKIKAGYADSAGSVAWGNVTGKPSTYTPAAGSANYLKREAWWNASDTSKNANTNLKGSITFAYVASHGTPTNGTVVDFLASTDDKYDLQIQGQYNGENLWFRNRNGDNNTWNAWRYVIHNGNISSQSVSSASTATTATTATTAAKLGRSGDTNTPMTFNWSGQSGQPSWLWGGSDGTNMYVYNPSNFSVKRTKELNYATDTTDINSANGNGWYSVAQAANANYDGHNPLAINWYWGIDMRTRGIAYTKINGYEILTKENGLPNTGGNINGGLGLAEVSGGGITFYKGSYYMKLGNMNQSSQTALTANRYAYFPNSSGTIAWFSSSRRVKKNIRNMTEEEAQKILDLDVIKFDYKDDWCGGEKNRSGFIAEDVMDILPETVQVSKNYDPNLPVDEEYNFPPEMDYQRFVPYLVKMVQMQQEQINELKAEIKALKEG